MRPLPPVAPFLLVALCALGIATLVGWQRAAGNRGHLSLPESTVFVVLRPVQLAFIGVGDWGADVGKAMFHRRGLVSDDALLRNEVDDLRGQTQRLARYHAENQELRTLLGMPKPPGGTTIPAEVTGYNATDISQSIVLNVGGHSGIRAKDVVYNAQGVVGQVAEVSPVSCRVLPVSDRVSGVGAMVARTMARGVLKGEDSSVCRLSYLDDRADVREGDLVITSGDSEIFPRGMVLGHVTKVERDKRYSQLSAEVDLAVAFDRLAAVYVRTQAG